MQRTLILSALILITCSAYRASGDAQPSSPSTPSDTAVASAVGAVVLDSELRIMQSRGSRNTLEVSKLIDRQVESIRSLPAQKKCDFFWTVAIAVELDGGYAYEFCELIAKECPHEFLGRATKLLADPGDVDSRRLGLIRKYSDCVTRMNEAK